MRICFTSDLHGRVSQYDRLTGLVCAEKPDVLILGGDMHADCDPDDPVGTQVAFVECELRPRIDFWKKRVAGLDVLCLLGNHDAGCTEAALQAEHEIGRLVLLDHQRSWSRGGVAFLGFALTPPTPYWLKDYERLDQPGDALPEAGGLVWDFVSEQLREVSSREHFGTQPALAEELRRALRLDDPWIFVCHTPPHATRLDRLPEVAYPIGSRAVREFIERRGPAVALHGHVHESPSLTGDYRDTVGPTLCVNPGQEHERLHAVTFLADRPGETMRHVICD